MSKTFISSFADKQTVHTFFLAKDKNIQTGKNGRKYMSLILSDKSGSIDARVWDNVEELDNTFQSGDVVNVKGLVQLFQGRLQFIVHKLEKAEEGTYDVKDFVSKSDRDGEEMFQELLEIVRGLHDPNIKQLILNTLEDPEIKPLLLISPAAKTIHHAKEGGLLEHVLSICGVMKFMASHYPQLNEDLLVFGAIFHDIGKVWELKIDKGIHYTDVGRLVGHLVLASELVEKKASQIMGFPENLKNVCKHIILSHHGKLEFGSPKRPKFLEAFVVAMIDDLDSKIDTISSLCEMDRGAGASWTRYAPMFDRYFYLSPHNGMDIDPEAEQ